MRKALAEEFGLNVHATFAGEREPDSEQDWKSHLLRSSSMMHPNERPHVDITFWVSSIKFTNAWRLRDLRHIYSDHGEYFVIDEDQEKVPKSAQRGFRKASRWLGLELSPLDDGESAEKASCGCFSLSELVFLLTPSRAARHSWPKLVALKKTRQVKCCCKACYTGRNSSAALGIER